MVMYWQGRAQAMERTLFLSPLGANCSGSRKAGETGSIFEFGGAVSKLVIIGVYL